MPRAKIIKFINNNYKAESVVIAASGSISHNKLVKLVKEKFDFPSGKAERFEKAVREKEKSVQVITNENNQIHLCLGYPGVNYSSKDKLTALAMHVSLGGGMSSTLFQKIREEKGLAYTVFTYLDIYRDAGVFGAYLATDKKNLKSAVDISLKQIENLKKKRLSENALDKVKAQLKGQLTLGMESTSSRMNRLARNEIMLGEFNPLKNTLKAIDQITTSDILTLSNSLFDRSKLALAVLGPVGKDELSHVI